MRSKSGSRVTISGPESAKTEIGQHIGVRTKRPPSVGWSELKRTKGQEYPATLQWWILIGSWSGLKRTEGRRRPCEAPTAEKPCDSPIAVSEGRRRSYQTAYQVPNTVMRQRLIRTVRKMVNQDSGKDVSAWAPGRPPIEAESAGQQTAGCHPRRQKSALVADSAPRCPRRWWWRWKEGPTRALPRTEVQPGAGRNRIGAGKVGSGLPVCPLPPTRSERPPHGKGQDGGGGRERWGPLEVPVQETALVCTSGNGEAEALRTPDMVSESWLGGATYPALHYRTPSAGKEGIQPSV